MAMNLYETLGIGRNATTEEGRSRPLWTLSTVLKRPSPQGLQEKGPGNPS